MSQPHGSGLDAPGAGAVSVQVTEAAALAHWDIANWMLCTSHGPSFPWRFDDFVAFYVLAGNATITPTDAWLSHRILAVRPGDMVLLPRGCTATWNVFPAITVRWVRGEVPPLAFVPHLVVGPPPGSPLPLTGPCVLSPADPSRGTAATSDVGLDVGSTSPGSKDRAVPPGVRPSGPTLGLPHDPSPAYVSVWDLPFPPPCQPPSAPQSGMRPTEPRGVPQMPWTGPTGPVAWGNLAINPYGSVGPPTSSYTPRDNHQHS